MCACACMLAFNRSTSTRRAVPTHASHYHPAIHDRRRPERAMNGSMMVAGVTFVNLSIEISPKRLLLSCLIYPESIKSKSVLSRPLAEWRETVKLCHLHKKCSQPPFSSSRHMGRHQLVSRVQQAPLTSLCTKHIVRSQVPPSFARR